MDKRELSVRLYGRHIGILSQDESGALGFQYAENVRKRLSISLPLELAQYEPQVCEAFFGGLLPEGELARIALSKRFGISVNNTFSLLEAIGHDCAGAVSFHALNEPEIESELLALEGRVLDEKELATHIRELPNKPLFVGVDDLRLSLAGAQDKAAVSLIDGKVALPQLGSPTTHILKPAIHLLKDTVQNEYLCLRVARGLSFNVPHVEMRLAQDIPYLLVQRYDREIIGNQLRRVHQEDFCQALGILSSHKYQSEGGPDFRQCFELLKMTEMPAKERNRLAEIAVFNYLIGNTDAHGKNFSLLHSSSGGITLAPFYDLLCTQAYSKLTKRMSMDIGGEHQIANIRAEHWEKFSKAIGFTYPRIKQIIQNQLETIIGVAEVEREKLREGSFDTKVADQMLLFFNQQVRVTKKRLGF